MRRSGKLLKYLATGLGVVILIAIIFSRVIFSSDRLTALVIPKISQLLNRDVSAEQVELSFFPTLGIKITGLRVANPSSGKFDTPYLVDAKSVVIDAKILPLLKNRLIINNVIFYSPTFFVERNSKGLLSTDRLLNETFYSERRRVRGSLSSLLLSNFEVANGTFVFDDNPAGISLRFLGVDFTSKISTMVEEDRLLLYAELRVSRFELWKGNSDLFKGDGIYLSAGLDYDKRHDLVKIQSNDASVFGIRLKSTVALSFYPSPSISVHTINADSSASGVYGILPQFLQDVVRQKTLGGKLGLQFRLVRRNSATDMRFDLRLTDFKARLRSGDSLFARELRTVYIIKGDSTALTFALPRLTLGDNSASVNFTASPPSFARASVYADIDLRKLARSLDLPDVDKFSGTIRTKYNLDYSPGQTRPLASGYLSFDKALVKIPIGIDTLYTGECDGSVTFSGNRAVFDKLLVRLGSADMVLSGTLMNYQTALIGGRNAMPSLRLNVASKTFSTVGLLPHMNLNIGRPLLAWLPTAAISIDFTASRFLMPSDSLTNVSARLQLLDYFVKLRRLDYTSSIGNFLVSGWTDYSQEGKNTFSIRASVSTPNFGRLLKRYLGRDEIAGGRGHGTLALNGVYDDSGRIDLASLGGRGTMTLSDVTLHHYSVLTRLFSFLGAAGRDSVRFKTAAFSTDITDGRLYFNRMTAYGIPLQFRLDGWHGFDGTLDYKLALKVFPPLSGEMAGHLAKSYPDLNISSSDALTLGIVAGGTTNDARFTIVSFNGAVAMGKLPPSHALLAAK